MIRPLFLLLAGLATAEAQVRQGGVYQIQSESLDAGGGPSSAGNYSVRQSLTDLVGTSAGGAYANSAGFAARLGSSGGTGAGTAAFIAWQTAIFGGPGEPGAGAMDDPDHDGICNLLEFSFNLPPLAAGTPVATSGQTGGLPWIREEEIDGARYFTMEYIRRKNAGLFQPETSPELAAWADAPFVILTAPVSVSGAYERLKIRVGPPIQPGGRTFYRLNVTIQ